MVSKGCVVGADWLKLVATWLRGQQLSVSLTTQTGRVIVRVIRGCETSRPAASHHTYSSKVEETRRPAKVRREAGRQVGNSIHPP